MSRRPAVAAAVALLALASAGCPQNSATGPSATGQGPGGAEVADADGVGTDAPSPSRSPSPARSPSPSPTPTPVVGAFDAERALAFATRLADEVGPRPAGSPADAEAQVMIADALRDAGWGVTTQLVALPQGGATQNLLAHRGPYPTGPHVVVGGHHDTVAGAPGANDNASGIGVLVALAEELADEAPAVPVVLVAYGAEEYQPSSPRQHHLGSDLHADAHGEQVVAALVIDMVGHGETTCICWYRSASDPNRPPGSRLLADHLRAATAGLPGAAGFEVRAEGDISDHGPYARRGVPAALLWTGRDGRYHTPADTSEHLRAADLQRAGDLALAFLRGLRAAHAGGLDAA